MPEQRPLLTLLIEFHPQHIESTMDYNTTGSVDPETIVSYLRELADGIEGRKGVPVLRYREGKVITLDQLPYTPDDVAKLFKEPGTLHSASIDNDGMGRIDNA